MKRFEVALLVALFAASPATAANGIFVYGCTSDGKPARMRLVTPLNTKPMAEASFRKLIKKRTSEWFLAQKKAPFGADWQSAIGELEQLSGGKLTKQKPALVARSIEIGKRSVSKKIYCGG